MSDCHGLPLPELLDALESRGVSLTVEAGRLSVRPWGKLSEAEKQRLRSEREAVITLLSRPTSEPEALTRPEPAPEPVSRPRESEKAATLRRWRESGPRAFTKDGRRLYAALLTDLDVPESAMTPAEIMMLRESFADTFNFPFRRG